MHVLWVFVAVGVGTFLMRTGPQWLSARLIWPRPFLDWLTRVTPAALGALLAPALLLSHGHWVRPWASPALTAAAVAAMSQWWLRQLLVTVAVGVGAYMLLGAIAR